MSTDNRIEAGSTALLLNDLQAAIISGSPLAPSDPDAHDRGYRVIVLADACASATASRHDASLANLAFLAEVVTTEAFASGIEAPCGAA